MDTPQAAASLFGSDDSSNDPFAVIGAEGAQDAPSTSSEQNTGFLASAGQDSPFDYQPGYVVQANPSAHSEPPAPWDAPQTDFHNTQAYPQYDPPKPVSQYDDRGSFGSNYNGTTASSYQPPASHYTPSSYLPPAPQPTTTRNPEPAPAVDRYAPVVPPATTSHYQPYGNHYPQPSNPAYTPYGGSAYPTQPLAPTQPSIPTPAPPKVSKPPERPKVLNAYDPPFPTTKPRRPAQARPPAPSSVYNPYQAPVNSPIPPPLGNPPPRATPPPFNRATPPPARATPPPARPTPPPARATPPPRPHVYQSSYDPPVNAYAPRSHLGASSPTLPQQPPVAQQTNVYDTGYAASAAEPNLSQNVAHQSALWGPPQTSGDTVSTLPEQNQVVGQHPPPPAASESPPPSHQELPHEEQSPVDNGQSNEPQSSLVEEQTTPVSPPPTKAVVPQASDVSVQDPYAPPKPASPEGHRNVYEPIVSPTAAATDAYSPPATVHHPYAPAKSYSLELRRQTNDSANPSSFPATTSVTDRYAPPKSMSPDLHRQSHETAAGQGFAAVDPYAPAWAQNAPPVVARRTDSPGPISYGKPDVPPPPRQVYSPPPPKRVPAVPQRDRASTNGSAFSQPFGVSPYAPVVPVPLPQPTLSQAYEPAPAVPSEYPTQSAYEPSHAVSSPPTQTLNIPASTVYAPSPSLLGSNDPLARTSAKAPVISFGFGGRFVTCFHGAATLSTGYDVALSTRNTTAVNIQVINKLLPKSVLETSEVAYPGPLFPETGGASIALVRSAASSQASKKARVSKYLEERASEINQGLAYLNPQDRQSSEAKLTLIKVLKAMVDHDGQLLGSSPAESAVRAALVPSVATGGEAQAADTTSPVMYPVAVPSESSDSPISVTTLTAAALTKIEDLLVRGERKQAYTYALDQKLWAHAMVIASSIDKESWKEVVNDFIHTELASKEEPPYSAAKIPGARAGTSSGHDGLRAAYSLFSGQGAGSVKELVPTKLLSLASGLQPPGMLGPSTTPRTPAFPPAAFAPAAPAALSQWRETAAMMITSPLSQDASLAISALGDQLLSYGWVEAAHTCYLLSPQTSPLGGIGSPAARITLLGSKAPHLSPLFSKDPDAFVFSEILEYAMSLASVPKGQDPFNGIPHLQVYRLIRATSLAELGDIQLAVKYCEAITPCITKPSPYFNPTFIHQLRILTERINGVSHSDKGGSWIGAKISKPSLDTIGGWLEGRFTKLVTGEGDGEAQEEESKKANQRSFDGPFAHFSNISNAPSARASPQPTAPKHNPNPYAPPQRTSSAMAMSSAFLVTPAHPIDRASSAIDHLRDSRQHGGPGPSFAPYGGYHPNHSTPALGLNTAAHAQQPQVGGGNAMPPRDASGHPAEKTENKPSPDGQELETPIQQHNSWWDYSSGNSQTPTAATFMKVDEPVVPDSAGGGGFISLMDSQQFSYQPKSASAPPVQQRGQQRYDVEEEEDDLGFGNSKKPSRLASPTEETHREPAKQATPAPAPAAKQESTASPDKAQAGGGWLSRWWKGGSSEGSGSGPIKAKLGEENSFYYDKELKRWVNKKAGAEEPKPTPPPPPPRAATASPSKASFRSPPQSTGNTPPPRATSAMDFASPAENSAGPRVRSNLVPTDAGTPPPPPMGGSRPPSAAPSLGPPPPSRPGSTAAKKKSVRSRYVDVFQQENTNA